MIHTSKQLKDKVRNISKGDNDMARTLIRTFMMERFLERVSLSEYRNHFILKGGMLIASFLGAKMRATMDIDASVEALPLQEDDVRKIIGRICRISLEDGVSFRILSITSILQDFEYPGIRLKMETVLERMRQVIKLDISTDDIITPGAMEYEYKLMFEDRTISLLTYNMETVLAEKTQTILTRGVANTRFRDFYDIYGIMIMRAGEMDKALFPEAFYATCRKRETVFTKEEIEEILIQIKENAQMAQMWEQFRARNYFVGDMEWDTVMIVVIHFITAYIVDVFDGNNGK